jgi:hypothetical protein
MATFGVDIVKLKEWIGENLTGQREIAAKPIHRLPMSRTDAASLLREGVFTSKLVRPAGRTNEKAGATAPAFR